MGLKLQGADVERHGPVGIVKIHPVERMMERSLEPECDEYIEVHAAIAKCLDELRHDASIRIVIITGSGDAFYEVPRRSHYDVEKYRNRLRGIIAPEVMAETRPTEVAAKYRRTPGYVELMLNYEKPLIARVNGNVIGAG